MTNLFCASQCMTRSSLFSVKALLTHSNDVSALGNEATAGTEAMSASQ